MVGSSGEGMAISLVLGIIGGGFVFLFGFCFRFTDGIVVDSW